jgi:hypothetical protein
MQVIRCTISFMDGAKMQIAWEQSPDASIQSASVVEKILNSDSFAFEVDGRFVMIPMQNVRTVEVSPSPKNLPIHVVQGARLM